MKKGFLFLLVIFCVLRESAVNATELTIKTKGGIKVHTEDNSFKFRLGGRIQYDVNSYDGVFNFANDGASGSDFFLRRGRVYIKGSVFDWDYKIQWEEKVSSGGGKFKDIYVRYSGWGDLARLTVGNQKEPFGLQELTSSKNTTAIERSIASETFAIGRSEGIKLSGFGDRFSYAVGIFKAGNGSNKDMDLSFSGRGTYLLISNDKEWLHIGVGLSERETDSPNTVPMGVSKANKITFFDGNVDANKTSLANFEVAYSYEFMHFSAEYFIADYSGGHVGAEAEGYWLQLGGFITGEQRPYNKKSGAFDKVKPIGKKGAVEVFFRLSNVENDDDLGINDEDIDNYTLGVNWYANQYVRMGLNYVHAETNKTYNNENEGDAITARIQIAF